MKVVDNWSQILAFLPKDLEESAKASCIRHICNQSIFNGCREGLNEAALDHGFSTKIVQYLFLPAQIFDPFV